jgi:hypothetical protein
MPGLCQHRLHVTRDRHLTSRAEFSSNSFGRLFATTDQWEYPGRPPYGQILVKDSSNDPWKVFEPTRGSGWRRRWILSPFRPGRVWAADIPS